MRYAAVAASVIAVVPPLVKAYLQGQKDIPTMVLVPVETARRLALAPVAFGVLLTLGFLAALWYATTPRPRAPRWVGVLLAAQLLVALLVAVELLFVVAAEVGLLLGGKRGLRWFLALCAGMAALSVAAVLAGDFEPSPGLELLPPVWAFPLTVAAVGAWMTFAYAAGSLVRIEAEQRRELSVRFAELESTQRLLGESTRMSERLHISRELHDTVGHHLTALSLNLQLASHLTEGEAGRAVREAHMVSRTLLAEVREVVGSLRAESAVDLRGALASLTRAAAEPRIEVSVAEELEFRDPALAHVLLRCAQEAVTNAIRHAGASRVQVRLERSAGLRLTVEDDGRGADAVRPGNGLRGMRERVEQCGGALKLETSRGAGFRIEILLPEPEEAA